MVKKMPCHIYEEIVLKKLVEIVSRSRCDCIALSGGIDTSTVLLATKLAGLNLRGYVVVYRGGIPRDLPYTIYISKHLGVDVEYVFIDYNDVENLIENVIECIGRENIDTHGDGGCIEIRNDIVFYTVLKRARDDGCRCVFVGSGGDEVFAGYSFMLSLREDELIKTIEKMSRGRFPELQIAKCLGIEVSAPLINPELVDIAMEIPIDCIRSQLMKGKEVLRSILNSYGLHIVGGRVKVPAEEGAGTREICRSILDNY
jgi:asparagine synthase (glutamine-hydrolysing)